VALLARAPLAPALITMTRESLERTAGRAVQRFLDVVVRDDVRLNEQRDGIPWDISERGRVHAQPLRCARARRVRRCRA